MVCVVDILTNLLFSSFINPVINFVSLIIMATLVAISIVTFTNNELKI